MKTHAGVVAVNISQHGCENHTRVANPDGSLTKIPVGAASLSNIIDANTASKKS
jgi:hypothetical protein